MSVYRFPKWLEELRFEITHCPKPAPVRFIVKIFPVSTPPIMGCGDSIAEAAKRAIKSTP